MKLSQPHTLIKRNVQVQHSTLRKKLTTEISGVQNIEKREEKKRHS